MRQAGHDVRGFVQRRDDHGDRHGHGGREGSVCGVARMTAILGAGKLRRHFNLEKPCRPKPDGAMTLRVIVFGAHDAYRTEASIVRAARALGHAATLVDADRWRRLGPLGLATLRRLVRGWAPDLV